MTTPKKQDQARQYGAIVRETRVYNEVVSGTTADAINEALDRYDTGAASAAASIVGRQQDGDYLIEVTLDQSAFRINQMQWEVNCSSLQERTTVDVAGNPIILSYPPSVDFAAACGSGSMAFSYTTYENQTGEADVYIACEEITGTKYKKVERGGLVDYISDLRAWRHTINDDTFFGHPKGNVLCMGVDVMVVGMREDGSYTVKTTYRFMTRPGSPLSSEGAGAGGWNTWHYWKDPNTGMVPEDVWDHKDDGAIQEVRHYKYKNFGDLVKF
mgnify:CR=1 FL=1